LPPQSAGRKAGGSPEGGSGPEPGAPGSGNPYAGGKRPIQTQERETLLIRKVSIPGFLSSGPD
jgi:hypothetical protein